MKVAIRTFGCRANHYDSEMVKALARSAGHEIVDDGASADVTVFNSCAVTGEAERDLRKAIRRSARSNPRARSVVMGCASALKHNVEVLKTLPGVERIIGGADRGELAEFFGAESSAVATVSQDTVRAVLRIQDGCDEHCTFCATTIARGANRSVAADALVREALALAEHHPEIVITGTHIGTYGRDVGSSLSALMERLVTEIPVVRFRLSSLEATEVDERLVDLFAGDPRRLAPHLHAPLQSGSNRLLKRMGRHWYTRESYSAAVERLAARLPVFALGADVIVGFPGETDADFAETVATVEDLPFTYLHVFSFSARPGTSALRLPHSVDPELMRERSAQMRQLGNAKATKHAQRRIGQTADVVVIRAAGSAEGMTEDYLTLSLRGGSYRRGERRPVTIEIDPEGPRGN